MISIWIFRCGSFPLNVPGNGRTNFRHVLILILLCWHNISVLSSTASNNHKKWRRCAVGFERSRSHKQSWFSIFMCLGYPDRGYLLHYMADPNNELYFHLFSLIWHSKWHYGMSHHSHWPTLANVVRHCMLPQSAWQHFDVDPLSPGRTVLTQFRKSFQAMAPTGGWASDKTNIFFGMQSMLCVPCELLLCVS